jgi:hypothetical protein
LTPLAEQLEDWSLARSIHDDLVALGMPRVNMLFVGRDRVTRSIVDRLLLDLGDPITSWHPGEMIPPIRQGQGGTLILHDVSGLDAEQQRDLLDWLDQDAGRTQIISTTPVGLVARVHIGTFIERLYYRLNTICVDAGVPGAPGATQDIPA